MKLFSDMIKNEYERDIVEALRALLLMALLEDTDNLEVKFKADNKTIKADITFEVEDHE